MKCPACGENNIERCHRCERTFQPGQKVLCYGGYDTAHYESDKSISRYKFHHKHKDIKECHVNIEFAFK